MPASLLSKDEVLDRLLATFRAQGYDGASLSALSAATGLGRSSLYHHFPGGKEDMVARVLERLATALERDLFAPLHGPGTPAARLDAMLATVAAFYDHGRLACLLERLCASVEADRFRRPVSAAFRAWLGALESLGVEAGIPLAEARDRAEDTVARVEGALVLAAGRGEPEVFDRALLRIRRELLRR